MLFKSFQALRIGGARIEVNICGQWLKATELFCPPSAQAQLRSRIVDLGIERCDCFTAQNGGLYRWRPASRPRIKRQNRKCMLLFGAAALLGAAQGVVLVCLVSWYHGGSADPRCAYFNQTGYVEVHTMRAPPAGEVITCEYRPEIGR